MCMKVTSKPSALRREALLLTRDACTWCLQRVLHLLRQYDRRLEAAARHSTQRLAEDPSSGQGAHQWQSRFGSQMSISECTAASASDIRMTAAVVISRDLPNAHVQIQPDIDEPVLT